MYKNYKSKQFLKIKFKMKKTFNYEKISYLCKK